MQDDVIFGYFTVREALTFAARLRLNVSEEEQDSRVNILIRDLGLESCADTRVGDERKKYISGGERKRTSIGVELITDPQIILLDEPTSGLDSFTAVKIVKVLQKLARDQGKTIISTIHQPSSESFLNFDRLILMSDGHIVYQGPAQESAKYFNLYQEGAKFFNPADKYMQILSVNYPKKKEDEDKIKGWVDRYSKEIAPKIN